MYTFLEHKTIVTVLENTINLRSFKTELPRDNNLKTDAAWLTDFKQVNKCS